MDLSLPIQLNLFSWIFKLIVRTQNSLTLQWITTTRWGSLFSHDSIALQMVHILSRGGAWRSGQPTSIICRELFHMLRLNYISKNVNRPLKGKNGLVFLLLFFTLIKKTSTFVKRNSSQNPSDTSIHFWRSSLLKEFSIRNEANFK